MAKGMRPATTQVGIGCFLAALAIHCGDASQAGSTSTMLGRGRSGGSSSGTGRDSNNPSDMGTEESSGAGNPGAPVDRGSPRTSQSDASSPPSSGGRQPGGDDGARPSDCLRDAGQDFTSPGRFQVAASVSGSVKIYAPSNLPAGCKVPIVHYSNGTAMNCSYYRSHLEHMASWGFLVACYESTQTGSGEPCMTGLQTLVTKFPDHADTGKIGSTGHSQGGGAAITCAYLNEQKSGAQVSVAVHAIMPAHGMNRGGYRSEYPSIKSPVFILSGSDDSIVSDSWIERGYEPLTTETLWYQAIGVGHMGPNEPAAPTSVAYFRWKLLGDQKGADYIRSLDGASGWRKVKAK